MIDNDPERADYLRRGLLEHPGSLYRAKKFSEEPPEVSKETTRVMGWYEWGPTLAILTQIANNLMALGGDRSVKSKLLKAPTDTGKEAPPQPSTTW